MQCADHGIDKNRVLETASPAGVETDVRYTGHMFNTTRQNNVGHPGLDHGRAAEHSFHAGNAYAVHGDSSHGLRNTCQKSTHTGCVQCVRVFKAAAKSYIIN